MPEFYMEHEFGLQEPTHQQATTLPSQAEPCTEQTKPAACRTENELSIEDNVSNEKPAASRTENELSIGDNVNKEKPAVSRNQKEESSEKTNVINGQQTKQDNVMNEKPAASRIENELSKEDNGKTAASRNQGDESSEKGIVINEQQSKTNGKTAASRKQTNESSEKENVINGQQSKEEQERFDFEEIDKKEPKEESDKENQDEKRGGGGRVESSGMNIPKSKSTSLLCDNGQQYRVRGILKTGSRSLSISSDEEDEYHCSSSCSVKKHVRFDEHISRKLFSSKCTILEQEKKYQKRLRHLSHKRERRVSETEASDSENHNRDRNNKFVSKKQAKRMNKSKNNTINVTNNNNNSNHSNNGSKNGKKLPGTGTSGGEAAASWDSQHSEMSEDESKTSCSCSATSESGGNTSDSGDSGAASGDFEEMKLSMLAASRKEHKRRGKKNARKSASSAKTAAASGVGEFGNSYVFELDMN
uniref:Uncharacterized protein n=1 Tax=Cacopsylla melanoneura TaxID=428564 RepID=A0A8D8RIL2_9HEMI